LAETRGAVAELDRSAHRVASEDDLCRVWVAHNTLPEGALVTTAGERIAVVYPGRRTGAGGPDFRDAILSDSAGHLRYGDVEVHLRSHDWIAHGHRADPAYDDVVLHVVLHDDGEACVSAAGRPIPVLALGVWLERTLTDTATDSIATAGPCRVSTDLASDDVGAIVRSAGRSRLEAKAAALESQIAVLGAEQALFVAMLDAAGYSRNRGPCTRLAARLPVERLQHLLIGKPDHHMTEIASAVLLGLAGLLRPGTDDDMLAVWATYADFWLLPPLSPDAWTRAGVRPANRPELRVRGVAALVARFAQDGLSASLLEPLFVRDHAALLAHLIVPAPSDCRTPLIGSGRAAEIAINVVTPFGLALARFRGDTSLEDAAWYVIERLPLGDDSEPLRYMRALLARSGHRLQRFGALESQGLLHLHHGFCSVHACWECPLAVPAERPADAG
jgi:hypothetical protein